MQVPPLNEAGLESLLSQPLVAKLATTSRTGEIRISPIWFGVQDGTFLINTFEDSALVKNLRRNPRCSLLIDTTQWPYYGAHYWGTASVEGPENDRDGMARLFAPYVGGREASAQYATTLIGWGKRVYVRFRPHRRLTWDFRQG
jgi:PPOX class probable F420-dependent enzyme